MIPSLHQRLIGWGGFILLAGLPFHAFITTWAGHMFGRRALWQSWKEIVIAAMILVALDGIRRNPDAIKKLQTKTNLFIVAFALTAGIITLVGKPETIPVWFGVKTNFEFLAAFLAIQLASQKSWLSTGIKVLVASSAVVAVLAIIQALFVPVEFLSSLGYGPNTILPHQTLPNGLTRAFSTIGGPNQLGAFLILPIALTARLWLRSKRWQLGLVLAAQLAALYFSYSRSAWLGTAAAVGFVLWIHLSHKHRIVLLATAAAVATVLFAYLPNSSNAIFVRSQVSDKDHLESVKTADKLVEQMPQGRGLGSAGPASFYGSQPVIPENYYLQLAIETGVLGLVLFLGVQAALAVQLWQRRLTSFTAVPLLASLMGIAVVNLFLHGWTDSSTAITYWALAGITVGGGAK